MEKTIAERMWFGDSTAIEDRRKQYESGELDVIIWASTLYSFRYLRKHKKELEDDILPLLIQTSTFRFTKHPRTRTIALANKADIISTILTWAIQQEKNPEYSNHLHLSEWITWYGLEIMKYRYCIHTNILLNLTRAELFIINHSNNQAYTKINTCLNLVTEVNDPNQKARIYRKCSLLLRKLGLYHKSIVPGVKACFVPNSARGVRLKSFMALTGCTNLLYGVLNVCSFVYR